MRKLLTLSMIFFIVSITACQNESDEISSTPVNTNDSAATCERDCLEGFVDQYLNALVAHDPSLAPFSSNVRYTENAMDLPFSGATEGLWANASTLSDYKIYIADPQEAQIAFVGFVEEENTETRGAPSLLSMRLKVEDEQITEVESVVIRTVRPENIWALTTPPSGFSTALASEEKVSREELIRLSSLYFDGIEQLNGDIVPWHPECYRLENGMWTAGPNLPSELAAHMPASANAGSGDSLGVFGREECATGFNGGGLAVIDNITPRRTPVVDVERGVTWGVYMFNHKGVETITLPDGTTADAPYFAGTPNSMPMAELFKFKSGEIRDIMAIGVINEYLSGSGWD